MLADSVSPISTSASENLSTETVKPLRQINDHAQSCSPSQLGAAQRYRYESLQPSVEEPSQHSHRSSSQDGNNERYSWDSVRSSVVGHFRPAPHASGYYSHHPSKATSSATRVALTNASLPGQWLPYTLRRTFLFSMATTSLAISVVLAILCWASVHNHGLRNDTNTTGLIIARRYVPTILAVFFTQALVLVSDDVKRTVPFARLACRGTDQFHSQHTWLYVPKPWWKGLREGFTKSRNDGRVGWVVVFSSLATGISVLLLTSKSTKEVRLSLLVTVWALPRLPSTSEG
jgi:hypothetical protein